MERIVSNSDNVSNNLKCVYADFDLIFMCDYHTIDVRDGFRRLVIVILQIA